MTCTNVRIVQNCGGKIPRDYPVRMRQQRQSRRRHPLVMKVRSKSVPELFRPAPPVQLPAAARLFERPFPRLALPTFAARASTSWVHRRRRCSKILTRSRSAALHRPSSMSTKSRHQSRCTTWSLLLSPSATARAWSGHPGFRIGEKAAMIAIDPLTQPAAAVQAALAMRSRCAR